ncbi:TolB family protein [Gracilimonas mengyeensis]|uniref:Oligogalacturonide lyase n=1 Tax=Gracilimonas mengyeensis TaxID=1302730 RepID=A0A521C366_9BACT|nr:PD40 domain-containing protein [Gracilimonas mengyeensis]SMO53927.1 oligogalacturonide lyase [Gracilimonas mengyeensis]
MKKQAIPISSFHCWFNDVLKIGGALLLGLWFAVAATSSLNAQVVAGTDYSDRAHVDNTFDMAGQDVFGQRFPSEHLTIKDEVSGIDIIALTTSRHHNSKIYQDHPQWTPDGEYLVFRSSRAEGQYYAMSMDNFEIVQITTGDNNQFLHLGWTKNNAYQIREGVLIEFDLGRLLEDSENDEVNPDPAHYETVVASLPPRVRESGGMGLDADEDRLFFASRLGPQQSAIYSIDFETGETTKHLEVPMWANHLQANEWVSGEIMYSWETGGDAPQRIWSVSVDEDGEVTHRPLYEENAEEWVTHEVFADKDHIIFNVMGHLDRLQKQPSGIFMMNIRTNEVTRLEQAGKGGYWHADATEDLKWAVGDTFDGNLYRINLETKEVKLLTAGHRPNGPSPFTREAHSHHSISPDGKWLLFNSSMLTSSDIMMVPLHPEGVDLPDVSW